MNLSVSETRVLGCMLEKQLTTPDIYPLTLNSLRLACNQSTNRDPVVDYDDAVLRDALHHLERRGFTRLASGRGRAPKYRHLLAEALPMAIDEQAVMCVLMLRGPQTPGELKQRAERMHAFSELSAVHETLVRLIERGLAACLERRPGQKEDRYTQLLEDRDTHVDSNANGADTAARSASPYEQSSSGPAAASSALVPGNSLEERVARLEREVAALRATGDAQAGTDPEAQAGTDPEAQAGTDPEAQAGTDPERQAGTSPESSPIDMEDVRASEPASRAWP
jgi:uncharacterized protein YceH (UPF0502 family)